MRKDKFLHSSQEHLSIFKCPRSSSGSFRGEAQQVFVAGPCSVVRTSAIAIAWKATLQEWKWISISWIRNLSLCFVLSIWLLAMCLVGASIARNKTYRKDLVEKEADMSGVLEELQSMDVRRHDVRAWHDYAVSSSDCC